MLWYVWVLLAGAILCGILGFGIAATAFAAIAKILFWLFIVGFVVTLVMNMAGRRA